MDVPMPEKQLDREEEGYGGPQKMQHYGGGAILEIAEEIVIGEDDEYDELYGNIKIGEGFLQLQLSEAPGPSASGALNEVIDEDEDCDELYGDINIEVGFLQLQVSSEAPAGPSANGATDPSDMLGKVANESVPLINPNTSVQCAVSQMSPNLSNDNVNVNHQIGNENPMRPTGDNGATMLFVGELHWWTTDVEVESVSSKYGRVKEIKFFDEIATGKSKGCCQIEFYDSAAAAACKEGMNGYNFNKRACTVEFASPHTVMQMGASYMNNSHVQPKSQYEPEGRRPMNDNAERGGGANYPNGDSGRYYGRRGEWARGQGGGNRGSGHMRGTGPPGGSMHPQGMTGARFYPTYMGRRRGSGYGDFAGLAFPRMMPVFPNVNAKGIPRVSRHVNSSIFGANGMGMMMRSAGMDGPHSGMWNDTNMGEWGAEEHGQRPRESSHGGKDQGGSEYGYGEYSSHHDKFPKSYVVSREKERASERDWSGNSNKRHRDGRERYGRKRYDREHRFREEKDDYLIHRRKYRNLAYKDDWNRGQISSRYRSRSRVMEVDHRSRSRDADYGKRSAYRRTHAF